MSRRKKLVIFLIVIVLGLGIVAYVLLPHILHKQATPSTTTSQAAKDAYSATTNTVYEQAVSVANQQGAAAGQSVLDKQLAKADTNEQKAAVYSAKAALATSPGGGTDYTNALQYALQSNTLSPTYHTAGVVAFCYEQLGDKANAIKYYQSAVDQIGDYTKADSMTQADYDYFQSKIQELQS